MDAQQQISVLTHTERARIAEKIACAIDDELKDMTRIGKRREAHTILCVIGSIMDV